MFVSQFVFVSQGTKEIRLAFEFAVTFRFVCLKDLYPT